MIISVHGDLNRYRPHRWQFHGMSGGPGAPEAKVTERGSRRE